MKKIIKRLDRDGHEAKVSVLLVRALFLSNLFSGSKLLSSLELTKGYSLSLICIPSRAISKELLDAQRHQAAARAMQKLISARIPGTVPLNTIKKGEGRWWV